MFDVRDSIGFYKLMIENYDDFVENSGSSRHAINCAISAFHIAEWIWGDWLSSDHETWKKLEGVRDLDTFKQWLDRQTPWFRVVQGVANGSKHFASTLRNTRTTGSYVENGYVEHGYQQQFLEIEIDGRWTEAIIIIEELAMFWESFLSTYRPHASLARPRHLFTHRPE